MDKLQEDIFTSLNLDFPLWERVFTLAPLIVVGTKEEKGYDLVPKHMAMPLGHVNHFGFICTPWHGTYKKVRKTKAFTVSFPTTNQVVSTSLSASPRLKGISKSESTVNSLPQSKASFVDALLLKNAYLYLECELYKMIDSFEDNSIITGIIKAAHVHHDCLRMSEIDEGEQLYRHPLFAYIAPGQFAKIMDIYMFPFPKDFNKC